MSDQEDRREAKTDPVGTDPPPSGREPLAAIPPAARVPKSGTGHEMLDDAIASVVDAARVVKSYHDELHADDGPFSKQTAKIGLIVKTNYDLIHGDVRAIKETVTALAATVEALSNRMANAEDRLDSGSSRFAQLDGELAGLRRQVSRLEKEIENLKNAAAPSPSTTG